MFAVGFLMRPIGGWIMGRYADRYGRRAALTLSVAMMALGSLVIAFTPGYASIGVAAPLLLVVARLVQGVSVGGEYATPPPPTCPKWPRRASAASTRVSSTSR
ncbi:hypothetical protein GCM10018954_035730 [Kutzneria kofuensis]